MFESLEDIILKGVWKCDGKEYPIYAHTDRNIAVEKYNEHADKTWIIFNYFLMKHEDIIFNIFKELNREGMMKIDYGDFRKILYDMVLFHDIGKINPKFQIKKLNNQHLKDTYPQGIVSQHSYLGALVLTSILMKNYNLDENPALLAFPYIILGHHTQLINPHRKEILTNASEEEFNTIRFISNTFDFKEDIEGAIKLFWDKYGGPYDEFLEMLNETKTSSLSFLYNLIYSYLIDADFIATSYAYDDLQVVRNNLKDFDQRVDNDLLEKIIEKFELKQGEYADEMGKSVLNKYRFNMLKEAKANIDQELRKNKRVFYLKMPTGGGKTNTSLALAIEILKTKKVNRLIYALPYVSILEQNYDYMKKVFNLEEPCEIRKIYSGTETIFDEDKDIKEKILTDDDFYNYPVICTTNVSLFNSIMKFNKKQKYRFSSLVNSVIILDEIQSLPSEYWPEFNFLINEMANWLNVYIIIMSATVPSLEKLIHVREQKDPLYDKKVCYLIKDPEKYYSTFERNEIKTKNLQEFDLSDDVGEHILKNYFKGICEENFNQNRNHGLIVLNTIETSQIIFNIVSQLSKENKWESEIMLLNSTLLPLQKRNIIERINNLQEDIRIILISTQTIEAGVDVSFDFVIRDFAILDSIEQVRGRCNRHKEKDNGNVYLIKVKRGKKFDCSKIYPGWRIQKTEEALKNNFQYNLSDIEKYYDRSIEYINKEVSKDSKLTSADNISSWNSLNFEENNSPRNKEKSVFHVDVIEEKHNSFSFFVEFDADMKHFSKKEIDYLEREQKDKKITLIDNGKVSGKGIIEYYCAEVEKLKHADFSTKKIFKREIMSIMSKFVFSSLLPDVEKSSLDVLFEGNKAGPFYVINRNKIGDGKEDCYSLKMGLNKKFFNQLNCSII